MKKKTSIVTGGAGFIGSHLCDYLLGKGHRVICIDDLITGSLKNIGHIKDENFEFLDHDITRFIEIRGGVDEIYHFASPASPIDYLQVPIQTLKVGALGTHNVLGLAKSKRAAVILASTSEVYGDPKIHPQVEEYWGNVNPVGPRGVYDEAKRFAEAITMAYHRQHGVDTRIARIFNTYGPRMRKNDGRVIPAFINQAIEGKEITVFGKGDQTRSFCFYTDMIKGIYLLAQSDYNEPLNLGNPQEMTILEVAQKIKKITASPSKIVFHELPEDDPFVRNPDISKARKILRWQPEIDFEDGLLKTIDWFRSGK